MTAATRPISEDDLHRRLAMPGPGDELKDLADTIDGLLARLQAAFDAQRQFVANASHELRTPLTLERALLEVALADPAATAATLRSTCEEVLVAGQQQEQLIEALLTLARSQRGLDHREPFDLADITDAGAQRASPQAQALALDVTAELSSAPATGDPSLAERLVANLIDNALRYNIPGGQVEVMHREPGTGTRSCSWPTPGPRYPPARSSGCSSPSSVLARTGRTSRADPASACPSSPPSPKHTTQLSASTRGITEDSASR